MLMLNLHSTATPTLKDTIPPSTTGYEEQGERRQHEAFLTDVVTVMERVVVGQSRYSQVPLGPQAIQLVPDDELPLSQGEESLHVVCCTETYRCSGG